MELYALTKEGRGEGGRMLTLSSTVPLFFLSLAVFDIFSDLLVFYSDS